jgi:hypothetical protein
MRGRDVHTIMDRLVISPTGLYFQIGIFPFFEELLLVMG